MPIYDFTCESGHIFEKRAGYEVETLPCPLCGEPAYREAIYLEQFLVTETGVRNGRRSAMPRDEKRYDIGLFQEACMERDYDHKRSEEIAQKPLHSENLWAKAKKRADAIKRGQAPPLRDTLRKN